MVKLGKSSIEVNAIGLGANAIGGHNLYPNLNEKDNRDLLRYAIDRGMNFIDTAYAYGNGRSEELIGQVLKEYPRDQVVIATKAAHDKDQTGNRVFNNRPEFLKQAVDEALQRLQTDYIDLFYIHFPDEVTPKNEAVDALVEMKDAGKIRAIGVSNFSLDQLKEANYKGDVDVIQGHYNLIYRGAEDCMLKYADENQMTFIPYFPLASGLLTGKYRGDETFPEGDLRRNQDNFQGDRFKEIVTKVNQLAPIANKYEVEIAQIVLAWYLTRPSVDAIIPGAKRKEQIESNLKAGQIKLSQEDIDFIDHLFSE